jgi:methyl-accepting chemotaxis protein
MELVLAALLAAAAIGLASTYSALRTERARLRRLEDRLAASRSPTLAPTPGPFPEPEPRPPAASFAEASGRVPVPLPPAFAGPAPTGPLDRLAATLVAPAERFGESIEASEAALAAAAERLRTPVPPAAPAPVFEEVGRAPTISESFERALGTAERVSDERSRLADDVRSLRAALERVAALDDGLVSGLRELARAAEGLGPLTASVSGLADRANLLGLNVSLLATRAGEAGAPFEEASAELRDLCEEARRLSRELSELARRNDSGARRVAAIVDEAARAAGAGLERGARAAERLGALDALCAQLNRALDASVQGARRASETDLLLARQLDVARASLDDRAAEAAGLRAEVESARTALRAAAERIEALRLDGGALRAAVVRVTSGA